MKRAALTTALVLGFAFGGTSTAYAGETNGHGGSVPGAGNAASECAFSGLDQPDPLEDNPEGFDDDFISPHGATMVQSYGIFVSNDLKAMVPSPGQACRGNLD